MKVFSAEECPQGSDLWWEQRRGLPTASDFYRIMTPVKQSASGGQARYIAKLLGDITDLRPNYFTQQGSPVNHAVKYGQETEGEARRWYEQEYGVKVHKVGFCLHDSGEFGCSPDGLIGEDDGLELKCCNRETHMLYVMKGIMPVEHLCQVHGSMIVTGRPKWHFCSYCVGVPAFVREVVQDEFTIKLRAHLKLFLAKFKEAKEKMGIKHPAPGPDEITPEIAQAVAAYQEQLAALDKADVEEALAKVNSWLDEIKEEKQKRPMVAVNIWRTVKRYADGRKWKFDEVNRMFRIEESVAF